VVGVTGFDLAIAETWDGDTVAFLLPSVPDDAPDAVREGIARRRITAVEGTCPCGAGLILPNRAARRAAKRAGGQIRMTVEHEPDCPAVDETLIAAIRRWRR
jgi:hypothetical protein